jgi:hypothetical protein
MHPDDVRRWVEARRFVEEHDRRAAESMEPEVSWRQALSLFALVGRMIGWPVAPDEIRRRENASAEQAWMRLRAAGTRPRP